MANNDEIMRELKAIRSDLDASRRENRESFRSVRLQLKTLEFGILTVAQKLLAQSEVEEIRERMAAVG